MAPSWLCHCNDGADADLEPQVPPSAKLTRACGLRTPQLPLHAEHCYAGAQQAIEQAEAVAYNIFRREHGYPERPYHPRDRRQLVSVGNRRGVSSLFHPEHAGDRCTATRLYTAEAARIVAYRIDPITC
jgi:hypothetical protein